ncbi:MAG: outer membrane beta-barrel protein [Xanthobacteraceae bacterium]|nr:outer membrane beta-barrel protein [Xanthobacteraceae bacterium]
MRRVVVATLLAGLAQTAHAADLPDFGALRGPVGYQSNVVNWQGYYVGGQASYGSADIGLKNAVKNLLGQQLNNVDLQSQFGISNWPLLGDASNQGSGFGGFVGYNSQWDDVVLGIEASYIHGKFSGSSIGSQGRSFQYPTDYFSTADVSAIARTEITDYGSVRARAGYAIDQFLPYIFGGVALGRANTYRSASATLEYTYVGTNGLPNIGPNTTTSSDIRNGHWTYGYATGLGVDVKLPGGFFLRGEYEYLKLVGAVNSSVNTVRGGVGYLF